ncbi:MAG TPA: T9SS type A sorting domain-containing protein, partial [Chitinophagales bacterium]|nr:T9SS type A sorting domain-containing protein [Chitinophagales bacterium]HNE46020.1 T9SS type A sorting domain-containing protein [Chitinophagales bacterium]
LIQLSVYPNPSSDIFVFEMKNFKNADMTVEVYNFSGELVDRVQLINNNGTATATFDASMLAAGTYMVKASDGDYILTQQITVVK